MSKVLFTAKSPGSDLENGLLTTAVQASQAP